MEPATPTLGEHVRETWTHSKTALLIGVVVWLPVATLVWWPGSPERLEHQDQFGFVSGPTDPGPLRDWVTKQPDAADVEVRQLTKPEKEETPHWIEVRYVSTTPKGLEPPWEELGYGQPKKTERRWSGKIRIDLHQDVGFYLFLLSRCLDVGFLIAAMRWLRGARRSGRPLPALFRGAALPATLWGLAAGLVLAGLALLYWWLLPLADTGIAGAWPWTLFWPGWAGILSLSVLPLGFCLCQELFFRGALLGSWQGAGHPRTGIVLSGVLYTVAQLSLREAPIFLVIGLTQAWLYNRTRSLLAPLTAGILCAALAITLPSAVIWADLLQELTQKTLAAMQNAGK